MYLEGLRQFLGQLELLTQHNRKVLKDKLKWRLEATQTAYQVKLAEERYARQEREFEEIQRLHILTRKAQSRAGGERLLEVTEHTAETGAPSSAVWLTAEQRSLVSALQNSGPDSPTNWTALAQDSKLSVLQLKSLAASSVGTHLEAVSFSQPEQERQLARSQSREREVIVEAFVTPPQSPERSES